MIAYIHITPHKYLSLDFNDDKTHNYDYKYDIVNRKYTGAMLPDTNPSLYPVLPVLEIS